MLHRQIYDFWQKGVQEFAGSLNTIEMLQVNLREMEQAQRFVFSESAALACRQLAEHPEQLKRAQSQLLAPFPITWMEFPTSELGFPAAFHFIGRDDGHRRGNLMFIAWPTGSAFPIFIPAQLDLDRSEPLQISDLAAQFVDDHRKRNDEQGKPSGLMDTAEMRKLLPQVLQWALAGWALLATKGMTVSLEPDLSKLNKARQRRGKYPLLGFTEIRLNLDVERVVRARSIVGTGNMPRHPVRAHLRLLASGKVAIVRAHWRGNPEFGVRGHHYTLSSARKTISKGRKSSRNQTDTFSHLKTKNPTTPTKDHFR